MGSIIGVAAAVAAVAAGVIAATLATMELFVRGGCVRRARRDREGGKGVLFCCCCG